MDAVTSVKRTSGPAPATPTPKTAPQAKAAPAATPGKGWAPRAPAAQGPLQAVTDFVQGLGKQASALANQALEGFRHQLEQSIGPYPSPADRPARTAQLDQLVAKMNLPPGQMAVLDKLQRSGASTVDLWQGSHMVFDKDQGALYDWLKSQPGAEARSSSHYPGTKTQQYQLMIGNAPLLFGKNPQGDTWMQMEGHPFHQKLDLDPKKALQELSDDAQHMLDYAHYVELGKSENIGPMGLSPHSEHHDPLHLTYSP